MYLMFPGGRHWVKQEDFGALNSTARTSRTGIWSLAFLWQIGLRLKSSRTGLVDKEGEIQILLPGFVDTQLTCLVSNQSTNMITLNDHSKFPSNVFLCRSQTRSRVHGQTVSDQA